MTLTTIRRYEPTQHFEWGERAIVVGASMAGLLAARVLADGFEEVTLIDRDPLPDEPVARRSVPQSRHIHVLLGAGQATLDDLFPGYGEDLLSAGGLLLDGSRDVRFYAEGAFLADGPRRLPLYGATRPLLEQLARRYVADHDRITIRPECRMTDLLADDAATTVEGVAIKRDGATTDELRGDLVVDATGRTSRTPNWLADHGYRPPPLEEVHVDVAYSSTFVRRPPDDRRAFVVPPAPPHTRGCGVQAVEGDRWLMTAIGVHGDRPPTDLDGFDDFAASLPVPHLKRLLDGHSLVGDDVVRYPFPANRRRRYEALDRFPEGLVVVGDAIASFNPVYAQGMSVAALEALVLQQTLAHGGRGNLAPRFFDRVEPTVDIAWNMAVGSDFRFPQTTGPKPRGTDFLNRYLSRLTRRAHTDGELSDAFFRVLMMERPPTSLVRPDVAWRVFNPAA